MSQPCPPPPSLWYVSCENKNSNQEGCGAVSSEGGRISWRTRKTREHLEARVRIQEILLLAGMSYRDHSRIWGLGLLSSKSLILTFTLENSYNLSISGEMIKYKVSSSGTHLILK